MRYLLVLATNLQKLFSRDYNQDRLYWGFVEIVVIINNNNIDL